MPTLIVAATSAGAGKTALTAAIADHLSGESRKIIAATGWASRDAAGLKTTLGEIAHTEPLGSESASVGDVAGAIKNLGTAGELLIIEGKTGNHADNLALAEETDALVLLVGTPLDDILHAASSYGSRLAGVVINSVPKYQAHEVESRVIPELQQANIKVIGSIHEDRRLLAPTVDLVADHLSADIILNDEESGRLIDNFLIGGMVLDWGPFYFGSQENVGVVVRGDRPDIQLAALQTDTVQAMVLTKGARPVEYVIYEATQRGIPLVMTDGSTEETAERLEGLQEKIRFDHPDKLERIRELAAERLDLDALDSALSQPVTR